MLRWAVLPFVVFAVLCAPAVHAQPIGPGHEAAIQGMVAPLALGHPVVPGVQLSGLAIGPRHLDWQLQAGGATATVHCALSDAGTGPSWVVTVAPEPPPTALVAAIAALRGQITLHDQGQWQTLLTGGHAAVAPILHREDHAGRQWAAVRLVETAVVWLIALVLAVVGTIATLRAVRRLRWTTLHALTLAVVVGGAAWVARSGLPLALLHCNNHGIEDARLVTADNVLDHAALLVRYGPAWFGPHWSLTALFGGTDLAMAAVASLAGSLAAVVVAAAAALRWGIAAGWAAGMAMAILPVAVRVGNSESSFSFGQLAAALVLLGAGLVVTDRRRLGLALMTASLWLLATGHTFGPGFAGAMVVLLLPELVLPTGPPRRFLPAVSLALLPVAAFLPLVLGADPTNRGKMAAATLSEMSPFKPLQHVLWLDNQWTPWPLVAAVMLGLALACTHLPTLRLRLLALGTRATGMWLLLGTAMFIGGSVSVGLRYQALLAPAVAWLIGAACAGNWVGRIAVLAALASTLLADPLARWADVEGLSYRSLADVVPNLPDRAIVVLPRRERVAGVEVVIDFPEFLAKRTGRHIRTIYADELPHLQRDGQLPPDSQLYAWRGPHCQAFARVVGTPPVDHDGQGLAVARRCLELEALCQGRPVVQGAMQPMSQPPDAPPNEFHQFLPQPVRWSLTGPCATIGRTVAPQPPR